jgi:hypothetical protein
MKYAAVGFVSIVAAIGLVWIIQISLALWEMEHEKMRAAE